VNTGESLEDNDDNLEEIHYLKRYNRITSVSLFTIDKKIPDYNCLKNYHYHYLILKKFNWLEKFVIAGIQGNPVGFSNVRNPYFYGEVSISRTARYFPMFLIFKPIIILSAFSLFMYWRHTLNFFNFTKNQNSLFKFSKSFFYIGVLSCIFLALHAIFLGLDFDSKLFTKVRRAIIILFILFEVCAQFLLTKSLYKSRSELEKYINPLILNIKIIFITIVVFVTCVAFMILSYGDPSTSFKHILEWNYFCFLLLYYFLSRLLWK